MSANNKVVVIAVFNGKGGAGKTTVAVNIAGAFGIQGKKVLVVDLDKQGSAVKWISMASDEKPFPAHPTNLCHLSPASLGREILKHANDYDYIVIDCPPAVESPMPSAALIVADLAIVPFQPAPLDVWAMDEVGVLIERALVNNPDLVVKGLINLKKKSATATAIIEELKEGGEDGPSMDFFATEINSRPAFLDAQLMGAPVHYVPRSTQAVKEIDQLVSEIKKSLKVKK